MKNLLKKRDLFSHHLIKIPTPHFVVFYNGTEVRPVKEVLKLSAAFAKPSTEPELELACTVYNINMERDEGLLKRCSVLNEYRMFVDIVRGKEMGDVERPIEAAIDECIKQGILKDFLQKRRAEVIKAMTIDMTFERREQLIREEERTYGREEGRIYGREEGRKFGREEGQNEKTVEFYRNCLQHGMSREESVELSGITKELLDTIGE